MVLVTMFSHFQAGFCWFLLNYTDFAHATSEIKPSKYDVTSGSKIYLRLKKKKLCGWGCGLEQAPLRPQWKSQRIMGLIYSYLLNNSAPQSKTQYLQI